MMVRRVVFYGLLLLSAYFMYVVSRYVDESLVSIRYFFGGSALVFGLIQAVSVVQVKNWGDVSIGTGFNSKARSKLIQKVNERRRRVFHRLALSLVAVLILGFASFLTGPFILKMQYGSPQSEVVVQCSDSEISTITIPRGLAIQTFEAIPILGFVSFLFLLVLAAGVLIDAYQFYEMTSKLRNMAAEEEMRQRQLTLLSSPE